MKKEIVIAIFLGLTLGVVITYGVYRARTTLMKPSINNLEVDLGTDNPEASPLSTLVINSPDDEIIIDQEAITVAGTTQPNSFVVVVIQDQEFITTADESGNFSIDGTLEAGSNVIQVHSIDEDGTTTTQERTVIFSTISFDEDETTLQATQSAQEAENTETTSDK